jgi:hypothetical protein
MRERFPGHYRPTEEEFADLWARALIVPDTNVLLSLYRLPERTRAKLLEILGRLQERLFLPHQVAAEFQRRRLDVIEEQKAAYETLGGRLDEFAAEVGRDMRRHPRLDQVEIEAQIKAALAPVRDQVDRLRDDHPEPLTDGDRLGPDTVRDALDRLFAERLGPPREPADLLAKGRERYKAQVPPGYLDEKKGEPDCFGDLAIWLDVLDASGGRGEGVILVTEERKEDWWWRRRGEMVGPRPELVVELAQAGGGRLYLYSLERFMEEAAGALELEFSTAEREEVIAARREIVDPASLDWQIDHDLRERAEAARVMAPGRRPVRFEPSPASGFGVYGGSGLGHGFPMSAARDARFLGGGRPEGSRPGDLLPGWQTGAAERAHGAELEIHWEPRPGAAMQVPGAQLTCLVIGADGERAAATVAAEALAAYVRFPDDFGHQGRPLPGTYAYEWYFEAPGTSAPQPVASGSFLIRESGAGE